MVETPDRRQIAEETARYLVSYVGDVANVDRLVENLEPFVRINGLTELLEYYFLLTGEVATGRPEQRSELDVCIDQTGGIMDSAGEPIGVLDYVSLLPNRLRSLEPAIHHDFETFEGDSRGRVDWNRTVKHRHTVGDVRGRDFVCRIPNRSAVTTGNRVLVELLATIRRIYERFDENLTIDRESDRPGWFAAWAPDAPSRERGPNVPVRKIVEWSLETAPLDTFDADSVRVSDREVRATRRDRNPLYREAAILLENYRRLAGGNIQESEAKELLSLGIFEPDVSTSDLFELYWIFKIVDGFEASRLELINGRGRGELVAAWEGDGRRYLLFNDWEGVHKWTADSDQRKYIKIELPEYSRGPEGSEVEGPWPTLRSGYLLRYTQRLRSEALGYDADRKFPDIALLRLDATADEPSLEKLFLAEVKHSDNGRYLRQGVQQLFAYGCYAKLDEDLRIDRESDSWFVASDPDIVAAPEVELAYFVGTADSVDGLELDGIQVRGFGEDPDLPFAESSGEEPEGC